MTEQSVVFVWENFGPVHADRCDAVARHFGDRRKVHGIELAGSSQVYAWNSQDGAAFQKHTLFPAAAAIYKVPFFKKAAALLRACWARRPADFFFCNYDSPLIFCTALTLRLTGARVFVMNDSKFDDYRRYLARELVKRVFYLPYDGAIASAARAADYLRFLGVPESRILSHYDTMSTERIRRLAGVARAPGGPAFAARHFTIVARLVEKKNIATALRAYALYRAEAPQPDPGEQQEDHRKPDSEAHVAQPVSRRMLPQRFGAAGDRGDEVKVHGRGRGPEALPRRGYPGELR